MKTICLYLLLISLNLNSVYAQSDSVIKIKDGELTCFTTHFYRITGTDSVYKQGIIENISGIKSLRFVRDDSLVFSTNQDYSFGLRTKNVWELSCQKKNSVSVWPSAVFGGIVGAGAGLFVGWLTAFLGELSSIDFSFKPSTVKKEENNHIINYLIGGLVGLNLGVAIGILIGVSDNTRTLNLWSASDKDKKAKLIKFLKQK